MRSAEGQDLVEYALVVGLVALVAIAAFNSLSVEINSAFEAVSAQLNQQSPTHVSPARPHPPKQTRIHGTPLAESLKKDCEQFVKGQLLFEPNKEMTEGESYPVFARISRNPGVNIARDLDSSTVRIERAEVSCLVSMRLDSEEENAFDIQKSPPNRPDELFVDKNNYTEWDWHVMPKRSGTLHLRLFVSPRLRVDDGSEPLPPEAFAQPPRIITVQSDRVYEAKRIFVDHWGAWLTLVSTVVAVIGLIWKMNGKGGDEGEGPEAEKKEENDEGNDEG
ncbi:MAG: Flp family type IVb pilin [Terracidiphilus sp.]